jgi:pimeloyl-ACP methyl ester carboxylesterase
MRRLASGGVLHVSGQGSAPLLLLHGVGGAAWSWQPQVEALAADCRCYAWEARGHGAAQRVRDAGLEEYFIDAQEALDEVLAQGAAAPFVAGHPPVYAPDGGRHASGALARVARFVLAPLVYDFERGGFVTRFLSRAIFTQAFEDRDRMERAWTLQRMQVPTEYPKMLYEAFEGPTGFPNRAFARELTQPVELVEGSVAKDRPRFPELVGELGVRLGERFSYAVIEGGHYLQLDRSAERVSELLGDFVRRWSQ